MSKTTGKSKLQIVRRVQGVQAVREALAAHGQALLPMLELIEHAQATVDALREELNAKFNERHAAAPLATASRSRNYSKQGT